MSPQFSIDRVYPSLLKRTKELVDSTFLDDKRLSVLNYKNCYALPAKEITNKNGERCLGGGLCCGGEWVQNSGLNLHSLTPYAFNQNEADCIEEEVIFIGIVSSIWGHAITDGIQHLWWFNTEDYLSKYRDCKIYYWGDCPLTGNFLDLIQLAGIDSSKLRFVNRPLLLKSVLIPDSCFVSQYPIGTHYYSEYITTIDYIISRCSIRSNCRNKVFFSEPSSTRNWGVEQIEKVTHKAGYHIIYPGRHSLQEQISILQSSTDVMVFESSVGHNIVFCKPGTHIIILRKANYANIYQSAVNKIRDYSITLIDVHLSIMNNERFPYAGPFFVYANASLCDYLAVMTPTFPWHKFKEYVRYNLYDSESSLYAKMSIPDNYTRILANEIEKTRRINLNRIESVLSLVPVPKDMKKRLLLKLLKIRIRHLL